MSVAAFVLVPVKFGAMIVNRFDHMEIEGGTVGVGAQLLHHGDYEGAEAQALFNVMQLKRRLNGDGVTVLDIGANIGAHTVNWAKAMSSEGFSKSDDGSEGWGSVIAVEPQERVFYALAGNIALNNCWNARAIHAAAGATAGRIAIPKMNPCEPANFGGLSLKQWGLKRWEADDSTGAFVEQITIDSLCFGIDRVDLIKIDVEGMEPEVLDGARETIRARRPVIYAEHNICGIEEIRARLPGYVFSAAPANVLCIHEDDPALAWVQSRLKV